MVPQKQNLFALNIKVVPITKNKLLIYIYLFFNFQIGYIVYRHFLHRNVTSMNFDNPVYRKTTEDQFSLEKNQYQPSTFPSVTVAEEVRTMASLEACIIR